MDRKGIIFQSVAKDETYQSYKDIEQVIGYQVGVVCELETKMQPKVVVMGGKR
jgi:hypothetical protein